MTQFLDDLTLTLWQLSDQGTAGWTPRMAAVMRDGGLGDEDYRRVLRGFRQMVHLRRRVGWALGEELESLGEAGRDRARLCATRLLSGEVGLDEVRRAMGAIDWQAVLGRDGSHGALPIGARRLAMQHSLPDWVAERLVVDWPDDAEGIARAWSADPPLTVRVNRLRTTREQLAVELGAVGVRSTPTQFARDGLVLDTPSNVFELAAFRAGLFEVQDEGSQLIAEMVAPPPGGMVVDVCAGSGGKTLALAALLGGKGHVLALDVDERRLDDLRARARRAGASNIRARIIGTEAWSDDVTHAVRRAARVLVDAPCTGLGTLRRHPELRWRFEWSDAELAAIVARQRQIIMRAASLLAPGARLVYATCSVLAAENQDAVAHLLGLDAGLELMPLKEVIGKQAAAPISDQTGTYLQLLPHRHDTDAFFAAIVRRRR